MTKGKLIGKLKPGKTGEPQWVQKDGETEEKFKARIKEKNNPDDYDFSDPEIFLLPVEVKAEIDELLIKVRDLLAKLAIKQDTQDAQKRELLIHTVGEIAKGDIPVASQKTGATETIVAPK